MGVRRSRPGCCTCCCTADPSGLDCLITQQRELGAAVPMFEDKSFDAAIATATIDHWQDPIAGLREMRRVARRVVVFTKDFSDPDLFWLNHDYLPEFADLLIGRPPLTDLADDRGPRGTGAHSVGLRGCLRPLRRPTETH